MRARGRPPQAVKRMMSLTTTQRDLLRQLLAADTPLSAAVLGARLQLSPRQVQYGLREIKAWLSQHHTALRHTPGLGAQIVCSAEQRQHLVAALAAQPRFQLVLTPEQRRQLLALLLLAAPAPTILARFQNDLAVARATVLKDLELIEPWLGRFRLRIGRRQHRGFWVDGPELARRQALAALLWGDGPCAPPIVALEQGRRIVFALAQDTALLPAAGQAAALLRGWDLAGAQQWVAEAEAGLGGRFADEVVAPLALAIAVQRQRAGAGQYVQWDPAALRWLRAQVAWPLAARLLKRQWPGLAEPALTAETAALTLQLTAQARDEPWPGDLDARPEFHELIEELIRQIAASYGAPELIDDQLLRAGLRAHILPACVRQRFGLWAPPRAGSDTHAERYSAERNLAARLEQTIIAATGAPLPPDAHDDLILLLRAAVVRARPERTRRVLVVCPSGMATTQLLVARLRARLPRLGVFEVMPVRTLSAERIADADLIISTVPLELPADLGIDVIQVHPMLHPEDIAALTQWMA